MRQIISAIVSSTVLLVSVLGVSVGRLAGSMSRLLGLRLDFGIKNVKLHRLGTSLDILIRKGYN